MLEYFLGKNLADFSSAQWAAVTDFAQTGILDHLANLGSSGVFKFGRDRGDLSVEKGQDFVLVGDGTSSHVADETSVALSGFSIGQDSKYSIFAVFFSRPLFSASKSTSKDESLEDSNTSKEGSSNDSTSTNGDSGTSSNGSNDDGALSNTGHGQNGKGGSGLGVHDDDLRVLFLACVPEEN
jgi:hypothetical protein